MVPDVLSSPVVLDAESSLIDEVSPEVALELDSELEVVESVDEEDDELVPWSASMLLPGCAASYAFSSSRESLPLLSESIVVKLEASVGAAAWISSCDSSPSPLTSARVQWCVELSALSLAFELPDVCAVAGVSEPVSVVDEELGLELSWPVLLSVVVDVEELVLWSASMLPVVLVPVAVLASGVVVVVPDTDVSLVGYALVGSPPWATAAELSRTDEMTIASVFLRIEATLLGRGIIVTGVRGPRSGVQVSAFGDIAKKRCARANYRSGLKFLRS